MPLKVIESRAVRVKNGKICSANPKNKKRAATKKKNAKFYRSASQVPRSWYDKDGYLKKKYRGRVRLNPRPSKRVAKGRKKTKRKAARR